MAAERVQPRTPPSATQHSRAGLNSRAIVADGARHAPPSSGRARIVAVPNRRHLHRDGCEPKSGFTEYYRRWTVASRFVTVDSMTVPGKGGRPRKWRSDADRVRAYRARRRGEQEPPTVDAVPTTADEGAAVAWERVRELGGTIAAQREELRTVHDQLRHSQTQVEHDHGARLVLEEANTRLRTRIERLTEERDELRSAITELRSLLAEQRRTAPPAPGPNRARRRQAERDRRRRR